MKGSGKDLILSWIVSYRLETDKIVEEELLNLKALPGSYLLDRAFLIMMDPNTGDILSMVGKKIEKIPRQGKMKSLTMHMDRLQQPMRQVHLLKRQQSSLATIRMLFRWVLQWETSRLY